MDLGDIPAWLALVISFFSAFHQAGVNKASELARSDAEKTAKAQRECDQRKNRVEQIQRDIEEIAALAFDYWMKSGSESGATGVLIVTKMRDVSSRISRYSHFLWPTASVQFLAFKQAVTGGSFQSHTRPAEKPLSPIVRSISNTSSTLKDHLRNELDKLDKDPV